MRIDNNDRLIVFYQIIYLLTFVLVIIVRKDSLNYLFDFALTTLIETDSYLPNFLFVKTFITDLIVFNYLLDLTG